MSSGSLDRGRGLATAIADELVIRFLHQAKQHGVNLLVVESDLARRGDPHLGTDVAYEGDRLLRWVDMDDNAERGARLLRRGSSGYPLNALVCDRRSTELELLPGSDLSDITRSRIAHSVSAVVVSAFDAETFLVWLRPELFAGTWPHPR